MISFSDYCKKIEEGDFDPEFDTRDKLEDAIAIISNMEPKEVADYKDILLELKKMVDMTLSGGM